MFSVIIPTLNEEKFLPLLLRDLSNQSYKEFEVIVVDGNSKDKTKREAKKFAKKLKLSIINSQKRNVSYQRNLGASKAKYQYLVFIDADSRIPKNFLKNLNKHIEKKEALIFLPTAIPDKEEIKYKFIFSLIPTFAEISKALNRPTSTAGGTMIINRYIFNFLEGFDEKLFMAEDHDLIKRAYKAEIGYKIAKNVKVRFSLRRMRKEGDLILFYKYAIVIINYLLLNKEIKNKIFDYKMGGERYNNTNEKSTFGKLSESSMN